MANGDDNAQTVPRIYILFPTLLGPVPRWHERLPAIAEMGFDWIFLNPVHLPGASGSLYAIKDTRRLHPLLLGPEADAGVDAPTEPGSNAGSDSGSGTGPGEGDSLLRDFCSAAADAGIRVMVDLVINHSARDGVLVARHPEWFAKDRNGDIRPPSVADLGDPEQVTVWEDLAELDYRERPERAAIIEHWQALISRYLSIGFAGFRCDAAYKLPGAVWQQLIDSARAQRADRRFFAETLGAPEDEIEQLRGAGFDYQFNSAKWWDFREDWLLEQYRSFRGLAPSIAFPESHDTPRLAAETNGSARESRFRYLSRLPLFGTPGERKSLTCRWWDGKGRHYRATCARRVSVAEEILGGGCGGSAKRNWSRRICCSGSGWV